MDLRMALRSAATRVFGPPTETTKQRSKRFLSGLTWTGVGVISRELQNAVDKEVSLRRARLELKKEVCTSMTGTTPHVYAPT